jgi:hypothetical protein
MTPRRQWLCYGTGPLPSPAEALASPLGSFPSWYLRMECARCGRERYLAETLMTVAGRGDQIIADLIERMRHDGCGGRPGLVELITAIPGASLQCRGDVVAHREQIPEKPLERLVCVHRPPTVHLERREPRAAGRGPVMASPGSVCR